MRNGLVALVVGGALVLAACGGGTTGATAAPTEAPAAESGGPTDGGAGTGGQPSAQASVAGSASEAPAGGGGGTVGNVCELVTEEELAGILGTETNAVVFAGPPDTCDIQSTDGAPLAATVLTTSSTVAASFVYDAFAADPSSTEVAGIGEKATYNANQALLLVLQNDKVLSIAVFDDGNRDETARLELMKQIGKIAAGRM